MIKNYINAISNPSINALDRVIYVLTPLAMVKALVNIISWVTSIM